MPVLILSGLQSALIFQRDAADREADYAVAISRNAAAVRVGIVETEQLLRRLSEDDADSKCSARLAEITKHLPGYINIMRFSAEGWETCSAAPSPMRSNQSAQSWFRILAAGRKVSLGSVSPVESTKQPRVLANVRLEHGDGEFAGVMTSEMAFASLLPEKSSLSVPRGAEVAIVGVNGQLISHAVSSVFPRDLTVRLYDAGRLGRVVWNAADVSGETRLFAAAPVLRHDVYMVLSGPSEGPLSWVRLHPISAFLLPILAFILALAALLWVAEQGVVRWIVYLRRIAALYSGGHYNIRPVRASLAPVEIRELADTIGAMAATIGARDAALKENLAAKDDLMREIHHRVKNNLQVISSLLNLQQRSLENQAAKDAIYDTRKRILALGLIYRALYEGPDLKRVDFRAFVNDLIAQLMIDSHGRIYATRTQVNVSTLTIDPDRLAPLALFIVETITSVLKNKSAVEEGFLRIDFEKIDEEATLSIVFNGDHGEPGESSLSIPGESSLSMMSIFARQLGGVLTVNADSSNATIQLRFPMKVEAHDPLN